ncbi:hypothetical protein [Liquorilactobacillus vini]|uniref:Polysaccharide polymerase n=1 Tax=Liquorilactobacillus vini DSM 20605 TaxID=1133569 RepID=A0A0R2BZ40_9LACO|nr:hypothetical protein [Liquorilactobacillus vini]KRM83906.1 hypothetical protein FD21_GL000221 [Liquorilactobacillus vini DSM 20605]
MIRFKLRSVFLFFSFFFLILGNSSYFALSGKNVFFEYLAFFLILALMLISYFRFNVRYRVLNGVIFLIVSILFNYGILLQNLSTNIKIRLVFSMLIIASLALLSDNYFIYPSDLKISVYGILGGILFCVIIALISRVSLTTLSVEGFGFSGFNGGLQHKNYLAADLVAVLWGLFSYAKFKKISKFDKFTIFICLTLLILSDSRGGLLLFCAFLLVEFCDRFFDKFKKVDKFVVIVFSILSIIFVVKILYLIVVEKSGSYADRSNGLTNYLNMYSSDKFHMIFGNAEMAFQDNGKTYTENIRSVTGWDGTTELAALSILVKNGLLGFWGYGLIFLKRILDAFQKREKVYKIIMTTGIVLLLVSSFVENYLVNMQIAFGVYCYLLIGSANGAFSKNED